MILKKRDYILILLIIFLAIFPFRSQFNLEALILSNIIIADFTNSNVGFWTIIILISILSLVILKWFFSLSSISKFDKDTERKLVSDDLFIVFFGISAIFYMLPMTFKAITDPYAILTDKYSMFIWFSILYIAILKLSHVLEIVRNPKDKTRQLFYLGDKKQYFEIFIISAIGIIVFLLISFLIPTLEASENALLTEDGQQYVLFMAFVSIPTEEFIFRGLLLDLSLIVVRELIYDLKKIDRQDRNITNKINHNIENLSWSIAIILSSVAFGLFHLDRYGYNIYTILYLIILAIIMGISRKIGGLTTSYVIHLINNIIAVGLFASIFII
jgi:hypothetical protein